MGKVPKIVVKIDKFTRKLVVDDILVKSLTTEAKFVDVAPTKAAEGPKYFCAVAQGGSKVQSRVHNVLLSVASRTLSNISRETALVSAGFPAQASYCFCAQACTDGGTDGSDDPEDLEAALVDVVAVAVVE